MCEESNGPFAHSPQCMYRSALFYAYTACRGMIDGDQSPKAQSTARRIQEIFKQSWLDGLILEAAEERFINAPFGTLNDFNRSEASWLIERMAVLAWALGVAELPNYYTKVDPYSVSQSLGIFGNDHSQRIAKATIRGTDEITMRGQLYHVLAWRLSEFRGDRKTIDLKAKLTAEDSPHLIVDGIYFIDNDLAVNERALGALSDVAFDQAAALVHYRYKEFRWLFGYEREESTISALN